MLAFAVMKLITKKFDETAKDLLVRTSLSELYGYHSKNNINDEKLNNIINAVNELQAENNNNNNNGITFLI